MEMFTKLSTILTLWMLSTVSTMAAASVNSASQMETLTAMPAATENSIEVTCRAKAKEVAAEKYRNCVNEGRNAEIDRLKKDYQERLRSLKEDYEKEIDKMGVKKSSKKKTDAPAKIAAVKTPVLTPVAAPVAATIHDEMPDESRMDLPEPIPVEKMDRN